MWPKSTGGFRQETKDRRQEHVHVSCLLSKLWRYFHRCVLGVFLFLGSGSPAISNQKV